MPRFYFHIRDCVGLVRDDEGMDLTGEIEAKHEALASAADIAANDALERRPTVDRVIEVHDEYGSIVQEVQIRPLDR